MREFLWRRYSIQPSIRPCRPKAYLYGLPLEYYEKYKIRRYGFHGTSHDFVSRRAARFWEKAGTSCASSSVIWGTELRYRRCAAAIHRYVHGADASGRVDYGTRSGDMDPAIVGFLAEKEGMSAAEVIDVCNKRSGVLGLSGGISSDFRIWRELRLKEMKTAQTTLEAYAYRVGKYIGAYAAAMNGVDAIVFTAGVGENNAEVRQMIGAVYRIFGNQHRSGEKPHPRRRGDPLAEGEKVVTMVVPTDEELAIARETVRLVENR